MTDVKDVVDVSYSCDACNKTFKDAESYQKHVDMNCIELYELSLDYDERNQLIYPECELTEITVDKRLLKAEKCVNDDDGGNMKRDWYFGEKAKRKRRRIMGVSRNELFSRIFRKSHLEYENKDRLVENDEDYESLDRAFVFFKDASEVSDALGRIIDGMKGYSEKYVKKMLEEESWTPFRQIEKITGECLSQFFEPLLSDWDNIGKILCDADDKRFEIKCGIEGNVEYSFGNYHRWDRRTDLETLKKTPLSQMHYESVEKERQRRIEEEKRREAARKKWEAEEAQRKEEEAQRKEEEKNKPPYLDTDWFLVKIELNWADEIDFNGFEIINGAERKEFEQLCAEGYDGMSIGWGTNEDGEYDSSDFESAVEYEKISEADKKVFERHGMMSGGNISYSCFINLMNEQKELLGDEEDEEENEEEE